MVIVFSLGRITHTHTHTRVRRRFILRTIMVADSAPILYLKITKVIMVSYNCRVSDDCFTGVSVCLVMVLQVCVCVCACAWKKG